MYVFSSSSVKKNQVSKNIARNACTIFFTHYNAHPLTRRQRKADDTSVSEQDQKFLKKGLDE
jgi:hypothetical protein